MDGRRRQRYVGAVPVMDDDHFHDQCGVFGVFGADEASNLAYLGLHSLQHRGQEAAGIVSSNGEQLFVHRGMGLVQDVFTADQIDKLPGSSAIGHVRYTTAGGSHIKNAQPLAVDCGHGSIAVAHNGNLTNGLALRHQLEKDGSIFSSDSDTEVLVHLIARSKAETMVNRVADALHQVEGAYSLVFLSPDELVAVRDPYGFRPLCLGKLDGAYVIASEPPAFQLIGAKFIRDIKPGEMVVISESGLQSLRPFRTDAERRYMCIFEYVYFARPDASFDGISVYDARKRMGRALFEDQPVEADIVVPVPDSGVAAALGYAEAAGLPFELGLIRSHYVGRTFIEPAQSIRHFGVRLKLHPVQSLLEGKSVVVIDDSIVTGHHEPQDRQDDPRRRRQGSPSPNQLPAYQLALLLRHRHPDARRAHRCTQLGRRSERLRHSRQPRLSVARRLETRSRRRRLLQRMLQRPLPNPSHRRRRTTTTAPLSRRLVANADRQSRTANR